MKRVLLADDSVAARKSIQSVLEVAGIEVVAVGNGDLALSRLEEVAPDMVLIDAIMPGRSGYEVCTEIKQNPKFTHLPVLLISSEFEPYDEQAAAAAGADGRMLKPFDISAINLMRDVWRRYAPEEASTYADTRDTDEDSEGDPQPEDEPAPGDAPAPHAPQKAFPGPDAFITSTMRASDIAEAEAQKAVPADVETTVPAGSGRPKQKENWQSALPDHVVDSSEAAITPTPVRRAPTTENLELEIAPEPVAGDRDAVRSVPIGQMRSITEHCVHCGAALVSGDIFCIACGAMTLVTDEEADRISKAVFCPECRQELLPGEVFCVSCGAVV